MPPSLSEWDEYCLVDLFQRLPRRLRLGHWRPPTTPIHTVGDFADHLCTLAPVGPSGTCESFHHFGRVRRAVHELTGAPADTLRPDTPLFEALGNRLSTWKQLSTRLQVRLVNDLNVDLFGLFLVVLFPLNAILALVIDRPMWGMLGLPLAIVQSLLAVRLLRRFRRVRPPAHLQTLGDLTCHLLVHGSATAAVPTRADLRLAARYAVAWSSRVPVREVRLRTPLSSLDPAV